MSQVAPRDLSVQMTDLHVRFGWISSLQNLADEYRFISACIPKYLYII